ncbi:MAG: hypothetical protein WAW92_01010 [Minisyncoccia bacterium]
MKTTEKMLLRELKILNEVIDKRILRGLSYASEARRHKFIVNSLDNLRRSRQSWMMRALRPLSFNY